MAAQSILNLEWLADTFDIGKPRHYREVEPGQSNPYAVLRVETSRGCYGIKRYSQPPRWQALNIEYSAASAGIPMAMPLLTRSGASPRCWQADRSA